MAAPDPQRSKAHAISPVHCGGDLRRADEMRAACDAFFARRGLNIYGGNKEVAAGGMRGIVTASAQRGKVKKAKREAALVDKARPA